MAERDAFLCAPGLRIEAHEHLNEVQFAQVNKSLGKIEMMMERLERRLWLTVYGVVGVMLAQGAQSLMAVTP